MERADSTHSKGNDRWAWVSGSLESPGSKVLNMPELAHGIYMLLLGDRSTPVWSQPRRLRDALNFSASCHRMREELTGSLTRTIWICNQADASRRVRGLPPLTVTRQAATPLGELVPCITALRAIHQSPANPYSWLNSVRFSSMRCRGRSQRSPVPSLEVIHRIGFVWKPTQKIGGKSALALAAEHCSEDLVLRFLKAEMRGQTDYDVKEVDKETLIHWAASEGHLPLVSHLLGADVSSPPRDSQGKTPLHWAASYDRGDVLKLLLKKFAIDGTDSQGRTPLHAAAAKDAASATKLLLSEGAGPNAQDKDGNTPLMLAIYELGKSQKGWRWQGPREGRKPTGAVGFLMAEQRVSITTENKHGKQAIHLAAECGAAGILLALVVDRKAPVDAVTKNGETALGLVARRMLSIIRQTNKRQYPSTHIIWDQLKAAKTTISHLIRHNAAVNTADSEGMTPLHRLVLGGMQMKPHVDLLLQQGADVTIVNRRGATALHLSSSSPAMFQMLLERGADPNIQDNRGNTAVHRLYARPLGRILIPTSFQAINTLLTSEQSSSWFDARLTNDHGFTVMHSAVYSRAPNLLQLAQTTFKIPINATTHRGATILHLAAAEGACEIIDWCLTPGAGLSFKTPDKYGLTPLHAAAQYGKASAVELLLQAGADPNVHGAAKQTPLHLAAKFGHVEVIGALRKHAKERWNPDPIDVHGYTPCQYACIFYHTAALELLVKEGASLLHGREKGRSIFHLCLIYAEQLSFMKAPSSNIQASSTSGSFYCKDEWMTKELGWTELHLAVFRQDDKRLEQALTADDLDVNIADVCGYSPLHIAAAIGNENALTRLIESGANLDIPTATQLTPLMFAGAANRPACVKILMDRGADVHAVDDQRRTVLEHVIVEGHVAMLRLICEHTRGPNTIVLQTARDKAARWDRPEALAYLRQCLTARRAVRQAEPLQTTGSPSQPPTSQPSSSSASSSNAT